MKKLFLCLLLSASAFAQSVTFTNTYTVSEKVNLVQTLGSGFINTVSSLGTPYTNLPSWQTPWIVSQIYTNGLNTNNVKAVHIMCGQSFGVVNNEKTIYQGIPPQWNGIYTCTLSNAVTHVRPGERLHVMIFVVDNLLSPAVIASNTNVIYNASGMMYKVITIPTNRPVGY